jgi:hypothetical protein
MSPSTIVHGSRYGRISFASFKEDHKNGGPEIQYEYEAKQYVKRNDDVKKLQ